MQREWLAQGTIGDELKELIEKWRNTARSLDYGVRKRALEDCADELEKWQGDHLDTHKLGTCLRFANGETCIGCGDAINGTKLDTE